MPTISNPASPDPHADRPSNREVENENQARGNDDGQPPRPATEPDGAAASTRSPQTQTDPGTGALSPDRSPNARNDPDADPDEPRTEG
ncbi:hypothetical protein [uncultured Caulobacter sp.]|uniref:hypothetical protein n=1 Tax=uncultured Caulobacter sp. TaxID=158749 RepID=UPI00260AB301|nr:hypothetical protein [uncultured Caulobacter sp.]